MLGGTVGAGARGPPSAIGRPRVNYYRDTPLFTMACGLLLAWSGRSSSPRADAMRTDEVAIASFHGLCATNWPHRMAAAVTAVVRMVLLFASTSGISYRGFR